PRDALRANIDAQLVRPDVKRGGEGGCSFAGDFFGDSLLDVVNRVAMHARQLGQLSLRQAALLAQFAQPGSRHPARRSFVARARTRRRTSHAEPNGASARTRTQELRK